MKEQADLEQLAISTKIKRYILVGDWGYQEEYSDIDLEVVVTEDRYNRLKKNAQKIIHTEKYDLIFTTIDRIQQVMESKRDEDHWWYKDCPVLLDKTGRLAGILKEITEYDLSSRLNRLKRYYLGYWENTLYSTRVVLDTKICGAQGFTLHLQCKN